MSHSNTPRNEQPNSSGNSINSPPTRKLLSSAPSRFTGPEGTGFPSHFEGPPPNFTQVMTSEEPRGNRYYEYMMRDLGKLGHFLPMDRKANSVKPIQLDLAVIRESISLVLTSVLDTTLRKKGFQNPADIKATVADTVEQLTTGCMMSLYCRLRYVNKSFAETSSTYILKPHVPEDFQIPKPFALAFQNLGLFRVENMTRELELIPHITDEEGTQFCLGTHSFSSPSYLTAMDFAKSVGLSFARVDLTSKLGTSWWLFKSTNEASVHTLQCCIPESNYTEEDAIVRALFCITAAGTLHAEIADLSSLTMNRGTFMRNAPPDIAITCYNGLAEDNPEIWEIR